MQTVLSLYCLLAFTLLIGCNDSSFRREGGTQKKQGEQPAVSSGSQTDTSSSQIPWTGHQSQPDDTQGKDPDYVPPQANPAPEQTPPPTGYCANLEMGSLPRTNPRNDAPAGSVLEDIVQHLPSSYQGSSLGYGNTYYESDQGTWAHETTHGIHAHLRNYFSTNPSGRRQNGFYLLKDQYIIVDEPPIRKSAVGQNIPPSLRKIRFGLYVSGQMAWDDTPLYIWDEWIAYINGAETRVENRGSGLSEGIKEDTIYAAIEMSVYAIGVAIAAQNQDNTYLASHPQFTNALGCNLERAFSVYSRGIQIPAYDWDPSLLESLRSGSEAEPIRGFVRQFLGSSWARSTLGF